MNVLIIDDQVTNRYLLEKLLEGHGYTVISAVDGIDALDKLRENDINLIVSDILLPRMDGFQLCREVKSNPDFNKIPFIFYTAAYTEQKDRNFAESLGADRFIVKPTDPTDFIDIIRNLVDEYHKETISEPKKIVLQENEYLSEHNKRLIHQIEKKLTELENMNKALLISEKRYKNLFEYANDAIILHEITNTGEFGKILEANGVTSTLLGYSHDELLGKYLSEIDTAKQSAHYQEFISRLLEKKHLMFDGEYVSKDGRVIPVEISAHLFEENGSRFCLAICRDITFRKQAIEELKMAIEQIDENLHQISTIGDQIRNPLSIILSSCEESDSFNYTQITDSVKRIDDFIRRLDISSVESEKVRNVLCGLYGSSMYKIEETNITQSDTNDR
ncbi:MAG: response regulator [Methanomicrobiales archaeon]|nr:response regulator [Methanomicrobiales archaeon]